MSRQHQQQDIFQSAVPRIHRLDGAEIAEHLSVFSDLETKGYFDYLLNNIAWEAASLQIAGRRIPIPRLQCWVADPGLSYTYSGISMQPGAWSEPLLAIRERVEQLAQHSFNAVLLNLYRNGSDSVSWHADDERELGENPVVASVSLGASRPFDLKPKQIDSKATHDRRNGKTRLTLHDGSVLIMGNTLQNRYLHQLPKVKNLAEPRINLTFRQIVGRTQSCTC